MAETFDNRYNEFFYSKESVKRQSDDTAGVTSPATLLAVGGAVFLANLLVSLSQPRKRFKLENDHFCGVTGGGKVSILSVRCPIRIIFQISTGATPFCV